MNLLGMKRKLLPYGMALGGGGGMIGSALGAMGAASNSASSAAPSSSGGGKSAPVGQNNYSTPFGGGGGAAGPSTGGGKSSGLGQGGYGAAPSFGGGDAGGMYTMGSNFGQPIYERPAPISSANSTTTADMMGGNRNGTGQGFGQVMQGLRGGKSSGLGQGGYGGAPGFGGDRGQMAFGVIDPTQFGQLQRQPTQGGNQAQMDFMRNMLSGMPLQQPSTGGPGAPPPQQVQQPMSFEDFKRSPMLGPGFGGVSPEQAQQRYQAYLSGNSTYGQGQMNPMQAQQDMAAQRAMMGGMGMRGMGGFGGQQLGGFGSLDMTQDAQRQRQMGGMGGGFQQPQFNPFQQQQFQQPQISGLQSLFNNMMQQQQMQQMPQQMPRFRSQALQYRPDMAQAQAALSRVKPSVQKENQDAQAARIAELEAQLAGYQTPTNTNDYSGG